MGLNRGWVCAYNAPFVKQGETHTHTSKNTMEKIMKKSALFLFAAVLSAKLWHRILCAMMFALNRKLHMARFPACKLFSLKVLKRHAITIL